MGTRILLWTLTLLWLPGAAAAVDVPSEGRRLSMRQGVSAESRRVSLTLRDPAIAAPLPDPRVGSRLILSGGAADGQCFADIPLDPAAWTPIRGDGARHGWRYRAPAPGTQGLRSITLRPGRILARAAGAGWPCDLGAEAQRLPLQVALRAADTRYCAAFGGEVTRNEARRFTAQRAPAPFACPAEDVTLANLNLLHGLFCSPDNCRQDDRIDLLFQWLADAGCPDVVTLQEIWSPMVPKLEARLDSVCPFDYRLVWGQDNDIDDSIVLTRYPVAESQVVPLHLGFRNVLHVRVDHPLGPLDVFSTHLASGADGGPAPCGGSCPQECVAAGAVTNRECQAVQTALFVEATHDVSTPALLAGDFNDPPGSFTHDVYVSRGWTDSFLAAGHAECDPPSGAGCTSGRDSDTVLEIESSAANVDRRIDFAFVVPPTAGSCAVEPAGDPDGDGTATGIFADDPNPFEPCGAAPLPVCWPSDHEGAELDLECR